MGGAVSVADVRDAAAGHLMADERGEVGERYILGGRNFTFDRLFADLGRLSGMEPPVKLPARAAQAAAAVLGATGRGWPPPPPEGGGGRPGGGDPPPQARGGGGWEGRPPQ